MYYLWLNEEQTGPLTIEQIRQMLVAGKINWESQYWQEGMAEWSPLGSIRAELAEPVTAASLEKSGIPSVLKKFLNEEQDPRAVEKVYNRVTELCTAGEEILYIAVQKKPVVTISPDSAVITNRRLLVFRPSLLSMSFEDFRWMEVHDVHVQEGFLGSTITATMVAGKKSPWICCPKVRPASSMPWRRRWKRMSMRRAGCGTWKNEGRVQEELWFTVLRLRL